MRTDSNPSLRVRRGSYGAGLYQGGRRDQGRHGGAQVHRPRQLVKALTCSGVGVNRSAERGTARRWNARRTGGRAAARPVRTLRVAMCCRPSRL
eukprot:2007829-Prymnesium_polylepis.1